MKELETVSANTLIATPFEPLKMLVQNLIGEGITIIGGGSKDDYLSKLTADRIDVPVYAGPTEATAIGNLLAQMLGTGVFKDLAEARETVFKSFDVKKI